MERIVGMSLNTVCNGCAEERFGHELQKVLENILDPNTEAKTPRSITLTLTIKPDDDRATLHNTLVVKSNTAPLSPQSSYALLGKDIRGKAEANEIRPPVQTELFGSDKKVVKMTKDGEK